MTSTKRVRRVFHQGDAIILAEGAYQGTTGVFLHLKEDVNWAEIQERNGNVRSHPVAWLAHSPASPRVPQIDTAIAL